MLPERSSTRATAAVLRATVLASMVMVHVCPLTGSRTVTVWVGMADGAAPVE